MIKKFLSVILCIAMTIPTTTFAVAGVVESPTLLAQLIKQYNQYADMLKKAQDQIERLNKVNDALKKANDLVKNGQLNFYNPMEILENLKDTIEEMEHNAKALAKSVRDFDIRDRIAFKKIQAKCPEISGRVAKMKYISNEDDSDGQSEAEKNKESYTATGEETAQDALLKEYLEEFTNMTLYDINSVTSSIRGLPQAILLCQAFYQTKLESQIKEQEDKAQKAALENDFNAYKEAQTKKMELELELAKNQKEEFDKKIKPLYIRTEQMMTQLGVTNMKYNKDAEKAGLGKNFFCEEGTNENGVKGCAPKKLNLDYLKHKEQEMLKKAANQTNEEKSQTQADREFLMIAYLKEIATHISFLNETMAMTASLMAENEARNKGMPFQSFQDLPQYTKNSQESQEQLKSLENYTDTENLTPKLNEFGFPAFGDSKDSNSGGGRTEL